MPLVLQNLRDDLREAIGYQDDTEFDNTKCDRVLNRSFWEVIEKIPFKEKEKTVQFPTIAGFNLYQVPSDYDAIRSIFWINDLDNTQKQIRRLSPEAQEEMFVDSEDQWGDPEFYYRENQCLKFWPIPNRELTITLLYWKDLADLDGADSEFPLQKVYYDIVLFGAVYRQALTLKQIPLSNTYRDQQSALLRGLEPKIETEKNDSRYAAVEVILPDYP